MSGFKKPTPEELAHDFLWRVHKAVPSKGMIGIFNRSHYEDVLIVRVHNLVPKSVWQTRYDHINHFEELLTDNQHLGSAGAAPNARTTNAASPDASGETA